MSRDFNEWMKTLKESIADFKYYTDFTKVYSNANSIKTELDKLNSLLASKNIESDFVQLIEENPEVLKVIPMLLAKRGNQVKILSASGEKTYDFSKKNNTVEEYVDFMRETGLFDLLENHLISDLNEYVKGIEVGLDSNARKNRTGTTMENIVENFILDAGFIKDETYFKQLNKSSFERMFGINLDIHFPDESKAEKRFDFVVKTESKVYAIEVNFYSGGGSKLNETARSYKMIAEESKNIKGFEFVWITDGIGWISAKRNLEETFTIMNNILNLNDLNNGLLKEILK